MRKKTLHLKNLEYFWFKEWEILSLPDLMIFHSVEQQNVL